MRQTFFTELSARRDWRFPALQVWVGTARAHKPDPRQMKRLLMRGADSIATVVA